MQQRDVRLNVITLDFANELGEEESDEGDIAEEALHDSKAKNINAAETKF